MAQGFILWFTGLSGSGKSTLAAKVAERLREEGIHVESLDGDEVRKHLSWGLGFSREDRDRNVRRIGYVARLTARSGACAITAAISPFRAIREEVRQEAERFCEVYCECPIEVLAERDPKGLYKKALAGEIKNFTGVTDPYEAPENPEIHLRTDLSSEAECLDIIMRELRAQGFLTEGSGAEKMAAPYAGELLSVAMRPLEVGADAPAIDLDEPLADETRAICAGYLSPVGGFMPGREAQKVVSLGYLEQGFAWPTAQLLPISAEQMGVPPGTLVRLRGGGNDFAEFHLQETFEREGMHYAGGTLLAIHPEVAFSPSARELRQQAGEAGLGTYTLVLARCAPTREAEQLVRGVNLACDGSVLLVATEYLDAWRALQLGTIVSALPRYLERHPEFDAIVGRNLGASHTVPLAEA